jgi:hypothetical protein
MSCDCNETNNCPFAFETHTDKIICQKPEVFVKKFYPDAECVPYRRHNLDTILETVYIVELIPESPLISGATESEAWQKAMDKIITGGTPLK